MAMDIRSTGAWLNMGEGAESEEDDTIQSHLLQVLKRFDSDSLFKNSLLQTNMPVWLQIHSYNTGNKWSILMGPFGTFVNRKTLDPGFHALFWQHVDATMPAEKHICVSPVWFMEQKKIVCASLFCPCCWNLPHFCPVMHSQPVNQ